nr:serine palmitoyltransferase small subunit A [Camelus dromedarius]
MGDGWRAADLAAGSFRTRTGGRRTTDVWCGAGGAWRGWRWRGREADILVHYQYLLVTALYMLEPWERTVFNSMLVSIMGMALYTGYVFMPQHIMAILHYFEIVQ